MSIRPPGEPGRPTFPSRPLRERLAVVPIRTLAVVTGVAIGRSGRRAGR